MSIEVDVEVEGLIGCGKTGGPPFAGLGMEEPPGSPAGTLPDIAEARPAKARSSLGGITRDVWSGMANGCAPVTSPGTGGSGKWLLGRTGLICSTTGVVVSSTGSMTGSTTDPTVPSDRLDHRTDSAEDRLDHRTDRTEHRLDHRTDSTEDRLDHRTDRLDHRTDRTEHRLDDRTDHWPNRARAPTRAAGRRRERVWTARCRRRRRAPVNCWSTASTSGSAWSRHRQVDRDIQRSELHPVRVAR